jgi:hypothetical protein
MPAKRVLLVDDNAAVRSIVRKLFESQSDFEISGEAENGRDAVEKAEKLQPDLIILDLVMPVMTGFEAALLIKREKVQTSLWQHVARPLRFPLFSPFDARVCLALSVAMLPKAPQTCGPIATHPSCVGPLI